MRTTIQLTNDLMIEAEAIAARTGRTVADVVEEAVRESFARRRIARLAAKPLDLPSFGSGGLRAGVDLDHNSGLLDTMDLNHR